jgi:hypothetical protein
VRRAGGGDFAAAARRRAAWDGAEVLEAAAQGTIARMGGGPEPG